MAQITIEIADNKLDFFKELIDSMDFAKVAQDYTVPLEHQDIVMERLEEMDNNPEQKLNWNDVKDKL